MRYDGYGTTAWGGELFMVLLVLGGIAFAGLWLLVNFDMVLSKVLALLGCLAKVACLLFGCWVLASALTFWLIIERPELSESFYPITFLITFFIYGAGYLIFDKIEGRRPPEE
ncbi:hypothetical protein [Halomonas cupida]|uniref:hypothetical protein n=1 Tax=Halomonas cupida TaxID=44933 RepID=UPI003A907EA6